MFDLPEGLIYLDGNSLGPLPRVATQQVGALMREEWGTQLIKGWNACGWMDTPDVSVTVSRSLSAPDQERL